MHVHRQENDLTPLALRSLKGYIKTKFAMYASTWIESDHIIPASKHKQ